MSISSLPLVASVCVFLWYLKALISLAMIVVDAFNLNFNSTAIIILQIKTGV
jgi:hypothetical protein